MRHIGADVTRPRIAQEPGIIAPPAFVGRLRLFLAAYYVEDTVNLHRASACFSLGLLLVGCVFHHHDDDEPKPRPPQCEEELLFCEGGCPDLPARVEDVRLDRADSRPDDEQPQYAVYTCDEYHVVARVKSDRANYYYFDGRELESIREEGTYAESCDLNWRGPEIDCEPGCIIESGGSLDRTLGLPFCKPKAKEECRIPLECPCRTFDERITVLRGEWDRRAIDGWRAYRCSDGRRVLGRFKVDRSKYHYYDKDDDNVAVQSFGEYAAGCDLGEAWEGLTPECRERCLIEGEGSAPELDPLLAGDVSAVPTCNELDSDAGAPSDLD